MAREVRDMAELLLDVFKLTRFKTIGGPSDTDLILAVPLTEVQVTFSFRPGGHFSRTLLLLLKLAHLVVFILFS